MPDDATAGDRLPLLHPSELTEEQRGVYDAITGGPRASGARWLTDPEGRLLGPFNAMLYSPAVGFALQTLGAVLRFESALTPRERETATLAVAAHRRSDFEWYAHERIAREAGLTAEQIAALRTGRVPEPADERERVIHDVARSLTTRGDLDDARYAEVEAVLGRATLVELVALVGYYEALALQMRVFRVGVPPGEPVPEWG